MNRDYLNKAFPTKTTKIGTEMRRFKPKPKAQPRRKIPSYPAKGTYVV